MNDVISRRGLRGSSVAWLVLLGVAVGCTPQASPSPSPSASPSAVGQPSGSVDLLAGGIEGRVVDANGNPLADVLITIETAEFYGTTETTDDGRFSARGVSGVFVITAVQLDYRAAVREVTVQPGETVEVELTLVPSG